jgi:hypothetical protein
MKKRTYILENKPKGAEVTPEMVKLLVPENENGYVPFANIQTSNFTAVNLVAYSTNGTLTVTDPTPETNKGYIVHVVGGTTTIDGVGYTAGALVYRFYDGTVWSSVEYAKKSDLPITIIQNNLVSTNSTQILARSINIGKISDYKKIEIDAETISDDGNITQAIELRFRNLVDSSEFHIYSGGDANQYIEKKMHVGPDNLAVSQFTSTDVGVNTGAVAISLESYVAGQEYALDMYINPQLTETITSRGITIKLYK